jgi:hypothetical protein
MDHNSRIQALNDLIAHGLTQADAMKAFGERTDEGAAAFIRAARQSEEEGQMEVDDLPLVSRSEDGYYVNVWLHVSTETARKEYRP